MTNDQIEADLQRRIDEARAWLDGNPQPVRAIQFRERNWSATPVEFLNAESRVERHGVGFHLKLDSDEKDFCVRINVRIKPIATITNKGDAPPFVVIYVINQETGAEDELTHQKFSPASLYSGLEELDTPSWFGKWIEVGLKSGNGKKIFKPSMSVGG